jgi:acetoin utilization deacetylase AcuC-like enzyme
MGFCLINNVAVAARALQAEDGVRRIAILDWDVHHGNGTQHSFYDDDRVFYASLHQHPLYPGTGYPHERGAGNTTLNVQMAPGAGNDDWVDALRDTVLPALERFDPELLILSCGFDAHRADPLAQQRCTEAGFAEMTRLVLPLAAGRVVSVLEGGYDLKALGACIRAHLRALAGKEPGV